MTPMKLADLLRDLRNIAAECKCDGQMAAVIPNDLFLLIRAAAAAISDGFDGDTNEDWSLDADTLEGWLA